MADGTCAPTPCSGDVECPANHECIESPTGAVCDRRSCLDDGDCAGACIDGVCFEAQASCASCF
jgi:hypothetical protein